ncbi:hypothetical protein KKH36_03520 [Patescibacteria group bacterium]|nr:hypothetical protein [Patescibacteria group bacterium]
MNALLERIRGKKATKNKLPFSLNVVYKSKNGSWRGFVMPYDITYESENKKHVQDVLRKMVIQYEKGLERYNKPEHLLNIPLSDKEDFNKFSEISHDLFNKIFTGNSKVIDKNYYAETKLQT